MDEDWRWAIQRIRDIQNRVLALEAKVAAPKGCVCPPGAEKTCESALCPRRKVKL